MEKNRTGYESPEIEIIYLDCDDIILTSGPVADHNPSSEFDINK